jgi:hypothetical protein
MTSNLASTKRVVDGSHGKSEDGHYGRPHGDHSYWKWLAENLTMKGQSTKQTLTHCQDFPSYSYYKNGHGARLALVVVADNHKGHLVGHHVGHHVGHNVDLTLESCMLPLDRSNPSTIKPQHSRWSSSSQLPCSSLNLPLCQDKPSCWLNHDVTPDCLQSPTSTDHDCDDSLSASFRSVDSIPRVPSRRGLLVQSDVGLTLASCRLPLDRSDPSKTRLPLSRWSSSSQLTCSSLNLPLCQDKPSSWLDHDVTPDYLQSPTTGSIDHDCDDSLSASFRSVDSVPRVPSRSSLRTFIDSDSSIMSPQIPFDRPVTSIGRAIRHA